MSSLGLGGIEIDILSPASLVLEKFSSLVLYTNAKQGKRGKRNGTKNSN